MDVVTKVIKKSISNKKSVLVHDDSDTELAKNSSKEKKPHTYVQEINDEIEYRSQVKVTEQQNNEVVDLTPNDMAPFNNVHQFFELKRLLQQEISNLPTMHTNANSSRSRTRQSMRAGQGGKLSIDELINGILVDTIVFEEPKEECKEQQCKAQPFNKSFVKITIVKSPFFEIHNQISTTVAKGAPHTDQVEADNRHYDYLTQGKGKVRRRADNDAQTTLLLTSSRAINTTFVDYATVSSYVSNFEMYDTMEAAGNVKKKTNIVSAQTGNDEAAAAYGSDDDFPKQLSARELEHATKKTNELIDSPDFREAVLYVGRTLSSNLYRSAMQRFRNFKKIDRCALDVKYNYSLKLLFRLMPSPSWVERKAVCDISFCSRNSDIVVIGYGLFSFSSLRVPVSGDVYVWSIKNPGEPERAYYYDMPVTAVRFSPFLPSLVAIGFYDGTVEVRNVAETIDIPVALSERKTSASCSPVVSIRWIREDTHDSNDIDPFFSLAQDGTVTRYCIKAAPFLLASTQMMLERIEGHPEGMHVPITPGVPVESNRRPRGIYITSHPVEQEIYYILTDEGCIYKCSLNQPLQYLEVLKCHDGPVNVMQFSPWSPKLFLTCGNDWYVRIWIDGITRPLVELLDEFNPVHWANWSPTHSTVIAALNRTAVRLWDIRQTILKPMSINAMDSSHNTIAEFSNSGTSLVVGNERGVALFQAINEMPFAPHFQYDELEKSIYKVVSNDQDLLIELKGIGSFGYPDKNSVNPN